MPSPQRELWVTNSDESKAAAAAADSSATGALSCRPYPGFVLQRVRFPTAHAVGWASGRRYRGCRDAKRTAMQKQFTTEQTRWGHSLRPMPLHHVMKIAQVVAPEVA